MEQHEKELLLARIKCGYYIYRKKDLTLYIYPTTKHQDYESQFIFSEAYKEALSEGSMVEEELLEMLQDQDLWNKTKEERLEELSKEDDKYKKEVFESFFNAEEREEARRELNRARQETLSLLNDRHSYDHLTCNGIATFAKSIWVIENTTKLPNGDPYEWEEIKPDRLLTEIRKDGIHENQYRELARTTPWRNFWNCRKSCSGVFDVPAMDLNTEQISLVSFSLMYDNIYQSTECPTDEIVEDNDAIDGWLILQREKQSKSQKEKLLEKLHSKHEKSKDIFVKADDADHARRINSLNGNYAQHVKSSRVKQIKETDGELDHYKFNDIQKDIKDQIMEAGI
tara:strand:- start:2039 stop:3061 length:1023 start_codon:yes stop_codon:yes gene_type:complete